jgi:hypothetical protein
LPIDFARDDELLSRITRKRSSFWEEGISVPNPALRSGRSRLDLGNAFIVCPEDAHARKPGIELARSVGTSLVDPAEVLDPGTQELRAFARGRDLLLLGTMADNPLIFRLYCLYHSFEDAAYPGPGGWVIRTSVDPLGLDTNAVILGASDEPGMRKATRRLLQIADGSGTLVPYLLQVSARGTNRRAIEAYARPASGSLAQLTGSIDRESPGFTGFLSSDSSIPGMDRTGIHVWYEDATRALGQAGFRYALSGDDRFAEAAARIAAALIRYQDELFSHGMRIISFDYLFEMMTRGWDLVEHATAVSPALREQLAAFLVRVIREGAHLAPSLEELETGPRVFSRHPMAGAFSFWVAARYLLRHFALPGPDGALLETRLKIADRMFGWAVETFCDDYNHPWSFDTIQMIFDYALEKPEWRFVTGGNAARAADLAALVTGSTGECAGYGAENGGAAYFPQCLLLRAEALYRTGRFGALFRAQDGFSRPVRSWLNRSFDGFHVFHTGSAGMPPEEHRGVAIAPVNAHLFEDVEAGRFALAAGCADRGVPRDRAFHKMSFRSGFERRSTYLLVEGISGVTYSSVAPAEIIALQDGGVDLLANSQVHASAFHLNAPLVAAGEPRKQVSYLARLDSVADLSDVAFARMSVEHGEEGVLTRAIVWEKGSYFLVVDRYETRRPVRGRLTVSWRSPGASAWYHDECRWRAEVGRRAIDILVAYREAPGICSVTSAVPELLVDGFDFPIATASVLRHSLTGQLAGSGCLEIASLLVPRSKADRARFHVRYRSGDLIEVAGPSGITSYVVRGSGGVGVRSVPADAVFVGPDSVTVIGLRCQDGTRDIAFAPASGRMEVTDSGWFLGTDFRWGPQKRWRGLADAAVAEGIADRDALNLIRDLAPAGKEATTQLRAKLRQNPPVGPTRSGVAEVVASDLQKAFGMKSVTTVAAGVANGEEWLCAAAGERRIVLFDTDGAMKSRIEAPGSVTSLWVGRFPGSAAAMLIAGTREGHTVAYDPRGVQLWCHQLKTPFLYHVASYTVGAAELQGVGARVVVGTYSGFYALDGSGSWTWGRHAYGGFANNWITADLFGEGSSRLIGASFMGCATVFDTLGEEDIPIPCWSGRNGRCHTLAVRDTDGDGIGELFLGSDCGLARIGFAAVQGGTGARKVRAAMDWNRTWRHWTEAEVLFLGLVPGQHTADELVAIDATGFFSRYGTDGRFLGTRPFPTSLTAAIAGPARPGVETVYALGACDPGLLFASRDGEIIGTVGLPAGRGLTDPARRLLWIDAGKENASRVLAATAGGGLHLIAVRSLQGDAHGAR